MVSYDKAKSVKSGALLRGGGGVEQLPWAAVSKRQQGKTKIKKLIFCA